MLRGAAFAAAIAGVALMAWLLPGHHVQAAILDVEPGGGHLVAALSRASPGDTLRLLPGAHSGPLIIDKSVTLKGDPGAVLDGGGSGHAIHVVATDVIISSLLITGSGIDAESKDSGVFLDQTADNALVENNHMMGNLVGVYVWGATNAVVRGNRIEGRTDLRMNDRGNGVYVWNAPGAVVEFNDISGGRDGIFVTASRRNVFRGNRMRDLRFAIHYMYTDDSIVEDNVSIGNHVGFALMSSHNLDVSGNLSRNDRDHGFLLNYANNSLFENNKVVGGGDKCVFIYNSNKNIFRRNWFERCAIGIHFTGGSERNIVTDSAFIGSRTQVKYVGTRWVEWSHDGVGNYWSDNPAFDMNGDGFSDAPYKPNDAVDQVMWRYPLAKTLLTSPAVRVLRWAQSSFPALYPGGVVDSNPLMKPPALVQASIWEGR